MEDFGDGSKNPAFMGALRAAFAASGLRQEDLGARIGYTQRGISGLLTGRSLPQTPQVTFRLEEALNLEPGALSRHVGYLPVGNDRLAVSVAEAILADAGLDDEARSLMLQTYEAMARMTRDRRANQRPLQEIG